jgi:hypothetical protein
MSADLGFDGVEVMVWADAVSQDVDALSRLSQQHGVPVLAVHAPCLLITQRVWSPEPEERLRKAVVVAGELGASTVVVHPPFRWQRRYADAFPELVEELEETSGLKIAVENMFPLRPPNTLNRLRSGRTNSGLSAFKPSPDRTPPRRTWTPSNCSSGCATASPTSTSPTAPAPPATSTCSPARGASRARRSARRWRPTATTVRWCWRSTPARRGIPSNERKSSPKRCCSPVCTWSRWELRAANRYLMINFGEGH